MSGPENGAIRIHADNWEYPGCPHSGPAIAIGVNGVIHTAWYTGATGRMGIHYATLKAGDTDFSAPTALAVGEAIPVAHPSLVALPEGGAVVAHNVDGMGRRVVVLSHLSSSGALLSSHELSESEGGTHPQSTLLLDGSVVVAWTQSEAGLMKVRLARLTLGGAR
jgi:hypothetical protein